MSELQCEGGQFGPPGHAPAVFNVIHHDMCLSVNVCRDCLLSVLIGWISAWQDDTTETVCVFCDKLVPHLEDAVKLTSLCGMPLGEAWKKFTGDEDR